MYGVCTLDVIAADAAAAAAGRAFIVATDARRREVYWARYDADGRRLDGPAVGFPATWRNDRRRALPARPCPTAGEGPLLYPGLSWASPSSRRYPAAGHLAGLAAGQLAAGDALLRRRSRSTCAGPTPGCPARRSG